MKAIFFALAVALFAAPDGLALAESPDGTWVMSNGMVTVRVAECGRQSLCAHIVGLKEARYKDGKRKIDRHNKNPALRRRPLLGLPMLKNMRSEGANRWAGKIYNPDDGNIYSATLTLSGDSIRVQGCVVGMLCKSETFVRVSRAATFTP